MTPRARSLLGVIAAVSLAAFTCVHAATASDPDSGSAIDDRALEKWVAENLNEVSLTSRQDWSDLEPLRALIGSATLVSLGEGLHGAAEPLEFRNRLFQFLVERMGFTAIALESGITESFAANGYVQGGEGEPSAVAERSITSGLGRFPQQAELLLWMRQHNLRQGNARRINFYGMDVSGFPGEPGAPLDMALRYLERVDATQARALRSRLAPMLARLRIDRLTDSPDQYSQLAREQRDAATAIVADLVTAFETRAGAYIESTSQDDYELAYRAAIAARQVDDYLRQVPVGWTAKSGPQSILGTVAVADRAKHDNIRWILEREGPNGRVLLFMHLGHAAPTAVTVRLADDASLSLPPMVGTYLKRHYADQLVTIGQLLALDRTGCHGAREPAPQVSLEGRLATLNRDAFVVDLRSAPSAVRAQLAPMHALYGQLPVHALRIDEGVDVLLFTAQATRALPCP